MVTQATVPFSAVVCVLLFTCCIFGLIWFVFFRTLDLDIRRIIVEQQPKENY
jgi:hypothetical protein